MHDSGLTAHLSGMSSTSSTNQPGPRPDPADTGVPDAPGDENDLDADGYPTDALLDKIANFRGTPRALVDLLSQVWAHTPPQVTKVPDFLSREVLEIDCVTHGWSGNESLIEALQPTLFWLVFWESSHRGGRYTFRVKTNQWDTFNLSPLDLRDEAASDA